MHYYFLITGLLILIIGDVFRRKNKVTKTYTTFRNYVVTHKADWKIISDDIIQKQDVSSLSSILGTKTFTYLIIKEISGIKVQALNNEKARSISLPQYEGILKKFENRDMFYTFNIDTGSIYYRFNPPYEYCILWIYFN